MDSKKEKWFGQAEYEAIANGCDVIAQDDIHSVRKPVIYDGDYSFLNDEIFKGMRETLMHSKKRANYKYGETGYVVRSDFKLVYIPVDGNYHSVKLINSELVKELIKQNISYGSLICIHNHPNNSNFSFQDIRNFFGQNVVSMIVVVGNTHNVFILRKCYENGVVDFSECADWMNVELRRKIIGRKKSDDAKNEIADYIIANCKKFDIEFIRKNRGKR